MVNLGIGLPTLVPAYLPEGVHVILQSENGIIGTGAKPTPEEADPRYKTDAGGQPAQAAPFGCYIDSATSIGFIRGGHVNATNLGGLEVDEEGSLSNWIIPGKKMPGMGGAMDLLVGAKEVIVAMEHTAKGNPKILKKRRLPYTAVHCITKIISDFLFSISTNYYVILFLIFIILFIAAIGIALGMTPLVGELYAQGDREKSSGLLQNGILFYGLLGVAMAAVQYAVIPLMYHLGQPAEVVDMAIPYYRMLVWSMPFIMLFFTFKQFLEGVGNTKVEMFVTLAANLANIGFIWVFIYGRYGFPEMGAEGAGLATFLSNCVACLYFFVLLSYCNTSYPVAPLTLLQLIFTLL